MVKKIRELNEGGVIRDGNMYVYDEANTGLTKKVSHGVIKENIGDYVMEKVSNELTKKSNIDLSDINDNGKNVIKNVAETNKKANVDLSNINDNGKNTILNIAKDNIFKSIIPNYKAGVYKSKNTTYTAEYTGLLVIEYQGLVAGEIYLYIDGVSFFISRTSTNNSSRDQSNWYIGKGSTYNVVNNQGNVSSIRFFPLNS